MAEEKIEDLSIPSVKLQMIVFHNKEFGLPIDIEVDCNCNVLKLKEICFNQQKQLTKLYDVGLLYKDNQNVVCLLQNNNETLTTDLHIKTNEIIYVFRVNDVLIASAYLYHLFGTDSNSKILSKHYIQIKYNKLLLTDTTKLAYNQIIIINNNKSMGDLRKILSAKLNINSEECVLRKKYNDSELKNNKMLLKNCRLHSGIIFVEKGKPLHENEYLFQLFKNDEYDKKSHAVSGFIREITLKFTHENDKYLIFIVPQSVNDLCFNFFYEKSMQKTLDYLGDIILDKNMKIDDIKHKIYKKFSFQVPHPSFMRIRDFVKEFNKYKMCYEYVLRDVYYSELTLHENLKSRIKDFQQIAIQRIECAEKDKLNKNKHLLLNICPYYPNQRQIGNIVEMQFDKNCKISTDLRIKLAEFSGIPWKSIIVKCFPKPNRLNDIQDVHNLFYNTSQEAYDIMNHGIDSNSTLSSNPWKCKNGYFIIYSCHKTKAHFESYLHSKKNDNQNTKENQKKAKNKNCAIM